MKLTDREKEAWVSWWFAFLERNDVYFDYCEAMAANDFETAKELEAFAGVNLADLYSDWGELWSISFDGIDDPAWQAWFDPRRDLFIDQIVRESVSIVDDVANYKPRDDHLLLDIPLAMANNDIVSQLRELLPSHRRADYKDEVILAKYQLYTPGLRGESLEKIENTYFILKNETSNKMQSLREYAAANQIGIATQPVGKLKKLLLAEDIDKIEQVYDRQTVRDFLDSKKASYKRFKGIGEEYSWSAMYGYFPCTNDDLERERWNSK